MRSFRERLSESKKVYSFKIGLAGELPESVANKLETALKRFGLISITSGKKTPIQERPLDFPNLKNTEVTYYDAELHYPTTDAVLQEYLSNNCSISASHVKVRNANDPLVIDEKQEEKNEPYEALLTKENIDATSAQKDVGQNRIMDLLKELEVARKEKTAPVAETGK